MEARPAERAIRQRAVRGFLIGAILCSGAALGQTGEPENKAPESQPAAEEAATIKSVPPSARLKQPDAPDLTKSVCDKPQTREDRDLCQQWRMAEAAEKQANWTKRQFWITVAEIAALLFTVFFTAWAAIAASRASKAADSVVEHARDTSKLELRPYLGVSNAHALQLATNNQHVATLTIENVGKTPAINVSTWFASVGVKVGEAFDWVLAEKPADIKRFTTPPNGRFILNIKTKGLLGEDEIREIREGRKTLYVFGAIEYTDVFGDPHTTTYRYEFAREHRVGDILNLCKEGNDAT